MTYQLPELPDMSSDSDLWTLIDEWHHAAPGKQSGKAASAVNDAIVGMLQSCGQVAYAAGLAASKWQSIETAPKDGTEILLYSLGDIGVCYWRDDDVMAGWTWGLGKAFGRPTKWQPLPLLPAPESEPT